MKGQQNYLHLIISFLKWITYAWTVISAVGVKAFKGHTDFMSL